MTKLKFFAFSGVGATALYPFTLLISSTVNESVPTLKSNQIQTPVLGGDILLSSDQVNKEINTTESSQRQALETIHKPQDYNDRSNLSTGKDSIEDHKQSEGKGLPSQGLSSKDNQRTKKPANFNEWLDSISPLIRKKQSLTIITKWNDRYFKLIQWDKDCQCFVEADEEYGIWSNRAGLFTIGKKWENPQVTAVSQETNPECTNFGSFWYQDWNTWWRLRAWLKSFNNSADNHTAVASCHKDPAIFLGTNTYIPVFLKTKGSRNISTRGPITYFYDHQSGKFESTKSKKHTHNHFSRISSYPEWKKLWNIDGKSRNWLWNY